MPKTPRGGAEPSTPEPRPSPAEPVEETFPAEDELLRQMQTPAPADDPIYSTGWLVSFPKRKAPPAPAPDE